MAETKNVRKPDAKRYELFVKWLLDEKGIKVTAAAAMNTMVHYHEFQASDVNKAYHEERRAEKAEAAEARRAEKAEKPEKAKPAKKVVVAKRAPKAKAEEDISDEDVAAETPKPTARRRRAATKSV